MKSYSLTTAYDGLRRLTTAYDGLRRLVSRRKLTKLLVVFGLIFTFSVGLFGQGCEVISYSGDCEYSFDCSPEECEICFIGEEDEIKETQIGDLPPTFTSIPFTHHWNLIDLSTGLSQVSQERTPCFDATGIVNAKVYYFAYSKDHRTVIQCEWEILLDPCGSPECDAKADFSFSMDGCSVVFSASNSSGSHTWDFGDGYASSEANPSHTYIENGSSFYNVTHTVVIDDETFTCTKPVNPDCEKLCTPENGGKITVEEISCGVYNFSVNDPCPSGKTASYFWDFGDGQTSTDPNPTLIDFGANGSFHVKVFVKCEGEPEDPTEYVCDTRVTVTCVGNPCADDCEDGIVNFVSFPTTRGVDVCSELNMHFIPFCNDRVGNDIISNHIWEIHGANGDILWEGESSGAYNLCIGTFNAYENPVVTVKHFYEFNGIGDVKHLECEMEVAMPPGIFIGCQCVFPGEGHPTLATNQNRSYFISDLTDTSNPDIEPVLDPDGTGNQNIYVNGTLFIDEDYSFSGTKLFMGMGALIHIEEERTLTFDSGTYAAPEPGCSCSWMGVEIEQNASFDMDASTIGNAVYGINLLNDNSSIDKEPSLTMNNSTLLGNYVGILAKDGPFLLEFTGNSIIGGELEICDCLQGDIIAGIGPVGPTYDPNTGTCPDGFGGNGMDNSFVNYSYAGIWVDDNFDKGIYLNIPGGNPNTFLNLPLGINVLSADADIIGCDFINIGEFGYDNNDQNFSFECQQVDLEAMPPEDVGDPIELEILEVAWGDGIRFDDKAGSHTLTVPTDNSFFNCVRGIYVTSEDGLTRANIFETDMLLVEKGINIVGSTSGGNVKFAQIQDNNIIANKSGSGGFGIEINDGDLNSSSFTILNNKVIVSHPVFANGINVLGWSPIDLVHEARIRRNNVTIIDGDFGINVSNIATSFVEENRIDIEDTNGGQAGINIEQGTKRHIGSCNTINNNNKSNDYIGLHVTGTEGSYNNNMTSNFSEGIKFDQDCNNSDVEKNIFKGEMGTGLSYGADAVTGEQENTGNHWSFNFSGLGANHAGGPLGNFEDSRYLAHDSQIPTFFPPNFFLEAGNVVDTGACAISNDPPSSFLTSSLSNLLVTNANHSFSEGSYFEMQRNLYENLVEYPDGMNESSDYQDFFDLHNEGIIGELYTIQSEFSALYSLDENTQFLFDNYESSLDDNLSQLRQIQNALYDQPENESLKQQWRNLIASNSVIHANYKNILSGLKSDRITNAAVIWDLNEQLVSTNLPSLNEKQLNKIYLEVIIMEERALSDSDRFIIEQIANQCYEQGGRAVFQARNWHYTISGNWLSNITCELEARIGTTSKNFRNEITEMNIVPNPNSGKMNIGFDPIKSDQVSLKITDVFGKELRNLHLSIGQSFAKINISEVSSGVYYAFLINDKKIVSTQKFIKE